MIAFTKISILILSALIGLNTWTPVPP